MKGQPRPVKINKNFNTKKPVIKIKEKRNKDWHGNDIEASNK